MHVVLDWLEVRTGVPGAFGHFLKEEIPASTGWAQALGSVTLFLFLLQAITGILLSLNFAPTPPDAHRSLTYIVKQISTGRMMHNLHHWGASLMIVVVFLHMAQVFIYGAYRKPREMTWLSGSVLLLCTLAFSLTGYLLPWDNRAYWGTVVTTRIIGSVPFVGAMLLRLAGAADGVGVITFSHFYALHTTLLPIFVVGIIAAHLLLVRTHGVTPKHVGEPLTQRFYPAQALRDLAAIFVCFVALFLMSALIDVPLERVADPTDASYVPRPEWYFLFLFELLRLLQGSFELFGTVILPFAAVALLVAIPFLPANRLHDHLSRAGRGALVVCALFAWSALTVRAIQSTPESKRGAGISQKELEWAVVAPEEIAGIGYFRSSGCGSCHNLLTGPPKEGPNLAGPNFHHPKEWLAQHFSHPQGDGQTSHNLSTPELNAMSAFLNAVRSEDFLILQEISPSFIEGAQAYVSGACASCHKVNGAGGDVGPALNGLTKRRSKDWVSAHFIAPQKLSPGSIMPPYKLTDRARDSLLYYLFSLPE
jgi:ubiquinol-cytochrome c reductase cytochrome b subunit